ncbi:AraC family transcriptional regulator [Paenibacillus sp. BIHB 4019]|uniref:AraC family transcriptional regulator n=1 Tax=Paenibacillus sp. BIHB 4019 TaxID=1870819 RepID=A0A1B2DE20_9BACL|nr:AraC family transcriptional regulator [Paenibacillus sp. BIHB 4019]ANY65964.1 AraC family transcriptional regulator [Paenibacillus sp. BIHB 4019]
MNVHDHIVIWNYTYCKLLDVRRIVVKAGEATRPYKAPASLFIMCIRGSAQVQVNGELHHLNRFKILHIGKGAAIDFQASEDGLEYYSVFYKATIPQPAPQPIIQLAERLRPFHTLYEFAPAHPVVLYRCLTDMYKEWNKAEALGQLHAKNLLFQFVHELLNQLKVQGTYSEKRDLAAQIIAIIQKQYAEPITLESLSESLNYSVPHLSSYFKSRTGVSPIDYLIKVRIDRAAALLLETDATLSEIAAGVGYRDPYYLGRLFKKYKGVSPSLFRAEHSANKRVEDCPSTIMRSSIAPPKTLRYTNVADNDYQRSKEGESIMFRELKPSMAAVLLLSFMLLLNACGTQASSNNAAAGAASSTEPSSTPQATASPVPEQEGTKIVSTIMGDVEVPLHPKRVVAGEYLGSLLALGVIPVGTSSHHLSNPYLSDALKEVEDLGDGNGSLEKILSIEPDLIIMDDMYTEMNDQLSKIAPTVIIPYASLKSVHEEVSYFGELLGKEQEATAWLADYDSRIATAKQKVLEVIPAESTFSVLEWIGKDVSAVGANYGKGGQPIYNVFSFKPPAEVAAEIGDPGWATLSNEVLPKYAGDYIVLTTDRQSIDDLKADPIWRSLDAVKNNRVFIWSKERSWYWDPIAILTQTEELADWLVSTKS